MDKYKILGFTTVPAALLFSAGILLGMVIDSWDILSLILTSITISLAIAIFAFQQNQSGKMQEVLEKVNDTNKEMHQVLHGKRRRIADLIMIRLIDFERGYHHVVKAYENYNKSETHQIFKDTTHKQIFAWNERALNLDVKGCDDPVMYDTFNEPIPSMYRELLENAYGASLIDKDEKIEIAFKNIEILREQMQPLIKELLKYTTPEAEFKEALEYYRTNKY